MEHILKHTRSELEKIHNISENYKPSSFWEFFLWFFVQDFKKNLVKYARLKEEILLEYSSLYSDISKDIKNQDIIPLDIQQVEKSILYITETIEQCGNTLEQMVPKNEVQKMIVENEQHFFVHLLQSFNDDLLHWVGRHEQEIFGEITKIEALYEENPLKHGKELLLLQKKRLESHIENISLIDS